MSKHHHPISIFALVLMIVCISAQSGLGQHSAFYTSAPDSIDTSSKLTLDVYNLNFIKNNEYFNFITDGLTLLGTQIHPELVYNNSKKTQLRAGAFVMKHFGRDSVDQIVPTFSFRYSSEQHQWTIGNFLSKSNHGMIEPMLGNERILDTDIIGTGFRHRFKSDWIKTDAWLNWENYIEKLSDNRERFLVGLSAELQILPNLTVPLQLTHYHKGGQINKKLRDGATPVGNSNIFNLATGLQYQLFKKEDRSLNFNYYYMLHRANSSPVEFAFDQGSAHYLTLSYDVKDLSFILGYYKADQFISPKGNEMFQTYSLKSNVNYWDGVPDDRYVGLTEPDRSLIFARSTYERQLESNVKLGLQVDGFFQLNSSEDNLQADPNTQYQFDYSYGVYVVFNDIFRLKE